MPALRAYFRRRVAPADIDDLVQDVMVSMQARASLEPILNIDNYLFTIASHVLSKHIKQSRHSFDVLNTLATYEPGVDDISPERMTLARIDLDRAKKAILQLPDLTKRIFILHRFEHQTYPQIAAQLSVSISTVEKHIMKAMRALMAARGWGR